MDDNFLNETRWLKVTDIEQLLTFAESPFGQEEFESILFPKVKPGHSIRPGNVLCRVSNALSGYVVWEHSPADLHVLSIVVKSERRRRGIAKSLLEFVIFSAQDRSVVLEVRVDNTGARKLYESLGFTIIGRRLKYYNGVDGHIMALIK